MILNCPGKSLKTRANHTSLSHCIVRKGYFRRKSDSRLIQRFLCRTCGEQFSQSTFSPRYHQKVRRINAPLYVLLNSGVSQNRAALILNVNPKTIHRRFMFLAREARIANSASLEEIPKGFVSKFQFDDLESSIHTKCKPVSVCLAVLPGSRFILDFQVNQMPAKGRLAKIAREKYGLRKDLRARGWNKMFKKLRPFMQDQVEITSDENPHYPNHVKQHFPNAKHIRIPGGRGAITGQGELRSKGYDPMFALNHTCAMLRANINRLFRKTWCTSKKIERLRDHIDLYVNFHNRTLIKAYPIFGGS
ncbi:MAG: hypothetical protein KGP28_12575 [Bdellovibrionales bacterium]|nr:hypothetical protein [Bdellovibrionales bacterium]